MFDLRGRTALIVEDEAVLALFVEDCLLELGMQVLGMVGCVEDALRCLAYCRPDIAVVDMNLHGESALPVIERLEALGIPFVVATGYGEDGGPVHRPHVPVLAKPYEVSQLEAAVARILPPREASMRDLAL